MSSFHRTTLAIACLLAAAPAMATTAVPLARASITPADLGIIIAQGDPLSEAIGTYYQSARGIPAANVVRVPIPTGIDNLTVDQLKTFKAQVDAALPANVQATVLTWTRPFRVQGTCGMSITSAFALGYDVKYCNNVYTAAVPYFDSDSTHPWQDFGIRPSMMLGASTYQAATALIDRGVRSDASYPAGDGYLIRTTDTARSGPRYGDFSQLPAKWDYPGGLKLNYIDNATGTGTDFITNKNPVLFYFTGLQNVPNLTTNTFVPGAVGDHLTSFGGVISGLGQMVATSWLDAGATGSYGTVEEPYAVQDKFPKASVVIDQYYRGATLIEAYWKSVRTPGQGLFLGEPLARPFADPGVSDISNGQYRVQTRSLRAGFRYAIEARDSAASAWQPLGANTLTHPGLLEVSAPVASNPDAELRLTRCATGINAVSVNSGSVSELLQGGRPQRAYFQLQVKNMALAASTCDQSVTLSIPALPDGLTAKVEPANFTLNAQAQQMAVVTVDLPSSAGETSDIDYAIPLVLTDTRSGLQKQINLLDTYVVAGTTTDPDQAPLLRIRRPSWNWQLGDYPERTSFYSFPIEVDARPDADIRKVDYTFLPTSLDDGSTDFSPYVTMMSINDNPTGNFAAALSPQALAPGYYTLEARAYNSSDDLVATTTVNLRVTVQFKTIYGTSGRDTIVGTPGNDIIVGGEQSDTLTGGAGRDIFVVQSIRDSLDTITDFTPGTDRIDLSGVLAGLGYTTSNARALGVVRLVSLTNGTQVQIDADGSAGSMLPRAMILLKGVPLSAIDFKRDLQLN